MPTVRLLLCCLLAVAAVPAQEWPFRVACTPGAEQRIALPLDAVADAAALRLRWDGERAKHGRDAWLELCLVTADERWFTSARPIAVPAGPHRDALELPLSAAAWSGRDGVLGGDALAAVRELRVRVHGGDEGLLVGTITALPAPTRPTLAFELAEPALVERELDGRPLWRELRLRLPGDPCGERGALALVDAGGRRWPCFLEQPAVVVDGAWRARGPARWVLRLAADERPAPPVVAEWRDGARTWRGPAFAPPVGSGRREPLPPAPANALPPARSPAWRGRAVLRDGDGFRLGATVELDGCAAPVLAWQAAWTGFRGPEAPSHAEALAIDRVIAEAVELDLLPQALAEEQGAFRFGLCPWMRAQGGPWQYPQDLLAHDAPWRAWRAHAAQVVARARAAPALRRWRLGLTGSANDDAQVARLRALARDLAALVEGDGRELVALHPQLVEHRFRDPAGVWCDFEQGVDGWQSGPPPFAARPAQSDAGAASSGRRALQIPLAEVGGVHFGGAWRMVDANVANLDRLEVDLRCDGPSGAAVQYFAWCTDHHHRWYQQPLVRVACGPRWSTVGIDFTADGAWTPVGHRQAWDGDQRRHLRRIGIAAYVHGAGATAVRLAMDRVRRSGWPAGERPTLAVTDLEVAPAPAAPWMPIAADFRLSLAVRNPYDPDSADVVAEVVAPDGRTLRYPAYWSEPFDLAFADGVERALPTGAGAWHWRFSPPRPGTWRWRLQAKVRWREEWLSAETPWTVTEVGAGRAPILPIRPDPQDPLWWRQEDGAFFYPLGINLRSPGDDRQDAVVAAQAMQRGADPAPFLSASTEKLGTRAYDRWFARMQAARMNWARVWMCPWWCGLEWSRGWDEFGGLTVYNQAAAARLDRVLALAATHGIIVQLELQNHGMTSRRVDQQWDPDELNPGSPYNRANGGPCDGPIDFYRRDDAWTIHAKRLRYTLARWGWCSHLGAIVLSSEMEFTGGWWDAGAYGEEDAGHSPITQTWIEKSLRWFAEHDPQRRPVSVHFSHPWRAAQLWRGTPGLAFSNSNAYTGFQDAQRRLGGPGAGLDVAFEWYLGRHFPPRELGRPTLIGEWGGHWERNAPQRLAAELRAGLWQQAVMPFGGSTGFWWWLWVDAADAWGEYGRVAAFLVGEDPRGADWRIERPSVVGGVGAIGMRCEDRVRFYAWRAGADRAPVPPVADAGAAALATGAPRSRWACERWDCGTGRATGTRELTADADGLLRVPLGRLAPDVAFKLRRLDAPGGRPAPPTSASPPETPARSGPPPTPARSGP